MTIIATIMTSAMNRSSSAMRPAARLETAELVYPLLGGGVDHAGTLATGWDPGQGRSEAARGHATSARDLPRRPLWRVYYGAITEPVWHRRHPARESRMKCSAPTKWHYG